MIFEQLADQKTLIVMGTGGVGKTSLAAATALERAQQGMRVLVLTIDPSQRLRSALRLTEVQSSTLVEQFDNGGELWAGLIQAKEIFDQFVTEVLPADSAQKLFANALYQQLTTNLSASQDFTSLERMLRESRTGQYDFIVLDTPPAQNAFDFIKAPAQIHALFQNSVTKWFQTSHAGASWWAQVMNKSTVSALNALKLITGEQFINELEHFFSSLGVLQQKIADTCEDLQRLLMMRTTSFWIVSGPDQIQFQQSLDIASDLRKNAYVPQVLIRNRARLPWATQTWSDETARSTPESLAWLNAWEATLTAQNDFVREELSRRGLSVKSMSLPELFEEPTGLSGLNQLIEAMKACEVEVPNGQ